MESPSTAELPRASTNSVPFFFSQLAANSETLQSLVSGVLQRNQARSDTFEVPTTSSPPNHRMSGRVSFRPPAGVSLPLAASRVAHRGPRGAISSRDSESAESLSEVDGAEGGPNTRSRKRRAPEPISHVASAAPRTTFVDGRVARKKTRCKPVANLKKPPPEPKNGVDDDEDDDQKPAPVEHASCCICMGDPEPEDLAMVSGCDHRFCFECIEKWAERENTCPLCKTRFSKIDRVNKQKRKKGAKNTKKVKQRDQRSDLVPGAALEGLLGTLCQLVFRAGWP
jgi:hypothetical protein